MNKIHIKIPDGLTPQEEIFAIAKKLGKALAPPKTQKALGQGYTIQEMQTEILVTREPKTPITVTQECGVCKSIFEPSYGFPLYTNYGGKQVLHRYCSDSCRQTIIDIAGEGRVSINKRGLKPARTFDRSSREERERFIDTKGSLRDKAPFKDWGK